MVSIIIPVYNNGEFIDACLRSVLNQTYPYLEIIVIDDGSTDDSGRIIDERLKDIPGAKVIHQENLGCSDARNNGLKLAEGYFVSFLDGDDYIKETYIEKMVRKQAEKDSELVISGCILTDVNGKELRRLVPDRYVSGVYEEWAYRICSSWGRLYKRELWEKYDIRFESGARAEDVPPALFFNAVCRNIVVLPEAEYFYVQHEKSIMHQFRGLHNIRLPYASTRRVVSMLENREIPNSREFFELGIMRFLTQCVFDLGQGAEKSKMQELCSFTEEIMYEHFPHYWSNSKSSLRSGLHIPFINKAEVKIFMLLLRFHCLYPAARLFR